MKTLFTTSLLIVLFQFSSLAQSMKDGAARDGLYSFKEKPFESIVTLLPVDNESNQYRYCGLRYKYMDKQGKTVYVVYSPTDVAVNRKINVDEYLYIKVKLIGKSITFEPEMMQVATRSGDTNSCRQDAVYIVDIKNVQ